MIVTSDLLLTGKPAVVVVAHVDAHCNSMHQHQSASLTPCHTRLAAVQCAFAIDRRKSCTINIASCTESQRYPLQCKPCFHIKMHLNTCFDHICRFTKCARATIPAIHNNVCTQVYALGSMHWTIARAFLCLFMQWTSPFKHGQMQNLHYCLFSAQLQMPSATQRNLLSVSIRFYRSYIS